MDKKHVESLVEAGCVWDTRGMTEVTMTMCSGDRKCGGLHHTCTLRSPISQLYGQTEEASRRSGAREQKLPKEKSEKEMVVWFWS